MKNRLVLLLTGVGGYVDAVSYLALGRVFTANMTGNTVLLTKTCSMLTNLAPWSDSDISIRERWP